MSIKITTRSFLFGSPIEGKPKLPEGFQYNEEVGCFLIATDGKNKYFVTKEELVLKDPDTGFLNQERIIKL